MAGSTAKGTLLKANRIMLRNIDLMGLNWPAFVQADRGRIDAIQNQLLSALQSAGIRPAAATSVAMEQLPEALTEIELGRSQGKTILIP